MHFFPDPCPVGVVGNLIIEAVDSVLGNETECFYPVLTFCDSSINYVEGDILGNVFDLQLAVQLVFIAFHLFDARTFECHRRKLFDFKKVGTPQMIVAHGNSGIDAPHVDIEKDFCRFKLVGVAHDGTVEFIKSALYERDTIVPYLEVHGGMCRIDLVTGLRNHAKGYAKEYQK